MTVKASLLRSGILMIALSVLLALIVSVPKAASGQSPGTNQSTTTGSAVNKNQDQKIPIMTRNLSLGTDLTPVIIATGTGDPEKIKTAVDQGWDNVQKTNFPERADALVDEIKQTKPLLVNLQEAELYRTGPPDAFSGSPTPATNIELDFLKILQGKLDKQGLHYTPKLIAQNYDLENPGHEHDIRLTDRDVILARTDLPQSKLQLSNVQKANFTSNNSFPFGNTGLRLPLLRGWGSVDVKVGDKEFRLINTHLEPESPFQAVNDIQVAQAEEILAGPASTTGRVVPTGRVVLAGDFNSRADGTGTMTYNTLIGDGFADAWSATNPKKPGYTCCQAANLLNTTSALDRRIDLVLFRGGLSAFDARTVGDKLADRTPSGLWPSDHAGVVAHLGWQNDQDAQ